MKNIITVESASRFSSQWGASVMGVLRTVAIMFFSLLILSCEMGSCGRQSNIAPEDQLHKYVEVVMNAEDMSAKELMSDLTTGDIKRFLETANEEAFTEAYLDTNYELRLFEIKERKEHPEKNEVTLEYILKYKRWNPKKNEDKKNNPIVEVRSRAILNFEQGMWLISNVLPLETNLDWASGGIDVLSVPNVATDEVPKDFLKREVKDVESNRDDNPDDAAEFDAEGYDESSSNTQSSSSDDDKEGEESSEEKETEDSSEEGSSESEGEAEKKDE